MAVPKKKTSKSKNKIRHKAWKIKVLKRVLVALSFRGLQGEVRSIEMNIDEST